MKKEKKTNAESLTQGHKIELFPSAGSCTGKPRVQSVLLTLSGAEMTENEMITLEENAEAVAVPTVKSAVMN